MSTPASPPVQPAAGVARKRPGVVTGAVVLLDVLGVGLCGLSLVDYWVVGLTGVNGGPRAVDYVDATIPMLFGVAMFVLGVFLAKGRRGARVTTWVVSALLALTTWGIGPVLDGTDWLRQNVESKPIRDLVSWAQIDLILQSRVLVYLSVPIVIIVLLALPTANAYFRRQPAVSPGSIE
jgi:hypothetical protein